MMVRRYTQQSDIRTSGLLRIYYVALFLPISHNKRPSTQHSEMAESSTPLLADESTSHIGPNDDKQNSPSHYFKAVLKVLGIAALVLSALTLALLIANQIILGSAPLSWSPWWTQKVSTGVIVLIVFSIIFAFFNTFFNLPFLINVVADIGFTTATIVKVVNFIDAFPNSSWCQTRYAYPDRTPIPPHPRCEHWKLVATILMAIIAGFIILLATIYVLRLLLRSVALYRSRFWKRPLALNFPTGEITFQISLRVLRQESGRPSATEGEAPHGPVYL
ncbi:hypothetical protein CPB84DRAFT_1964547 [Gymnopilus junonius]|uniref:Uncharacterized protein n=1 Tax=Gymnopilus junonius TaxID=109634 RepID=A0A9P5NI64_GYMJU|nr:hypothetical protein CPB84DRAFT_1964547 [Gymnopilus junonius]